MQLVRSPQVYAVLRHRLHKLQILHLRRRTRKRRLHTSAGSFGVFLFARSLDKSRVKFFHLKQQQKNAPSNGLSLFLWKIEAADESIKREEEKTNLSIYSVCITPFILLLRRHIEKMRTLTRLVGSRTAAVSVLTDVDPVEPNRPLSATVVTAVKGLHVSAVWPCQGWVSVCWGVVLILTQLLLVGKQRDIQSHGLRYSDSGQRLHEARIKRATAAVTTEHVDPSLQLLLQQQGFGVW